MPPIRVQLFAGARQLARADELLVDAEAPLTVARLRRLLEQASPPLGPLLAASRLAVNARYADESDLVAADDEVALIPPVSGG